MRARGLWPGWRSDGLKPALTFPDEVTRVCRRLGGGGCRRSGQRRVRGLARLVGVGFAMLVERLAGRCWVGRFVLEWDSLWAVGEERRRLGVGSRRWSMGGDRGRVLRYAQDDRFVVLERRIVARLSWGGRERWNARRLGGFGFGGGGTGGRRSWRRRDGWFRRRGSGWCGAIGPGSSRLPSFLRASRVNKPGPYGR